MVLKSLDDLTNICLNIGERKRMAVIMAEHEHAICSTMKAHLEGLIRAVLIGDEEKIKSLLAKHGFSAEDVSFVHETDPVAAVKRAVQMVHSGEVDYLMKGDIETKTMMQVLVARESGMRTDRIMSQVAFVENPNYHKLMGLSDSALNPKPDLMQKKDILINAVNVFHCLGVEVPKVAVLAAAETVNPKLQESTDALALKEMYQRGEITGCIVEGPISIDLALEPEAAEIKGYKSPVAGDADLLICPDLVSGNLMGKAMLFTGARSACIVVGAKTPVVLNSRAATEDDKYQSILLGAIACSKHI